MPIYEYQCTRCSTVRDIKHGFKERNTEVCAACGGELKRLFNPAGIVFKGSGFYINDSRKPATEVKSDKPDAAPKTENTETKSEPKSDTKGKGDAAA